MKHVGKELYRIIDEKRLVKSEIAKKIGVSPSYFGQMLHYASMDAAKLEKLCNVIGISPGYFFDEWTSDKYTIGEINNGTVIGDATVNVGENAKYIQSLLDEKERIIKEKERLIKVLLSKLDIKDMDV